MRSGLELILRELRDVYDDALVAAWFVRPNSSLSNAVPQACLADESHRLVEAARADRLAIRG